MAAATAAARSTRSLRLRASLLTDGKAPGEVLRIEAAFDPNGDGGFAFIGSTQYGRGDVFIPRVGTVWRPMQTLQVPYRDCPC